MVMSGVCCGQGLWSKKGLGFTLLPTLQASFTRGGGAEVAADHSSAVMRS